MKETIISDSKLDFSVPWKNTTNNFNIIWRKDWCCWNLRCWLLKAKMSQHFFFWTYCSILSMGIKWALHDASECNTGTFSPSQYARSFSSFFRYVLRYLLGDVKKKNSKLFQGNLVIMYGRIVTSWKLIVMLLVSWSRISIAIHFLHT